MLNLKASTSNNVKLNLVKGIKHFCVHLNVRIIAFFVWKSLECVDTLLFLETTMLKIILVFAALFTTSLSFASEESASKPFIYKGLMELGGGFSFQRLNNSNNFYLAPYAGYLITDKILIGGQFSFSTSTGSSNSIGLSPVIKYFFYAEGPWVTFVGQNVGAVWVDSTTTTQGTTTLGTQYFINAFAAFGINVNYSYRLNKFNSNNSMVQMLGAFTVYY